MTTSELLSELIDQATETMWGPELSAVLEKALGLAQEQGNESGEYRVRLLLGNNAQMTGDTDALLTNFAWCLAKHDDDPARFPNEPDAGSDLMWQFKWMVGILGGDPQFSTEQIQAVLADMEEHYKRANLGLSGVAMARFESAFHNGHQKEAARAFAVLAATERDEYSHCDACVRSVAMDYHFRTGAVEEGLKEFAELMDGGFSCGEEPEHAISHAIVQLLRAEDHQNLRSLHMRSYRDARDNADNIAIIANHLVFCAITGNEARGLAMAERHLAWLAHDPLAHRSHLNFLTALGLLLQKVMAAGHGEVPVRGSDTALLNAFFGQRESVLSAEELAPLCWAAADALAAEFDVRNGNDWHARFVANRRAMIAEAHDFPISAEQFNTTAPPQPEEPQNSEEWRGRALDLGSVGQFDAALAAYAQGVASTDDPRELAVLHNAAITIHAHVPGEEHVAAMRNAVALRAAALRKAGDEVLAGLTERASELLAAPDGEDTNPAKLALIHSELDTASPHPEAQYILSSALGGILLAAGELEAARATLDGMENAIAGWEAGPWHSSEQALRRARTRHAGLMLQLCTQEQDADGASEWLEKNLELDTSVVGRAALLAMRSRVHFQTREPAKALVDADAATDLLLSLGARSAALQTIQLSAAILMEMGRTGELRALLRFGIQQAQMAEAPVLVSLSYALAQDLVEHGDTEEAIELIDETLRSTVVEIGDHDRGELYDLLGSALRNSGELGGAVSAWTMGLQHFSASDEQSRIAELHVAIGSTYQEAGHFEAAMEEAQAGLDVLLSADEAQEIDPRSVVAARMQLAGAMSLAGDDGAPDAIEAAGALAEQIASEHQSAEIYMIRATHLFRSGDVDGAVAQALQGSSAFEKLDGAQQQTAWALLQAAHMLDNATRYDDAVALYRQVIDSLAQDLQGQEVIRHQLADCLESAGRTAEAATVRAEAQAEAEAGRHQQ
ncbi:hypothetical protein SAMN04489740_2303 [Arthrobacter alpinus]|uniref:Tetratricopeptide repeat protein n=1 Tax=Arthrobacter alpinus TaxID=656366 RepID=A0A1H5L725_9MICC|nr:hypothetical protein [Arthrobacter alpinus]SEE71998.1 hypothetical protein SAMN04489740_2303 [Arthrobacter alpinus]